MGTRVGGRRAVLIAAGAVSLLLSTAGCALTSPEFPPSGAREPDVVAAREAAAAALETLLATAAMGEPLSTSVQDSCRPGSYSVPWGPFDSYFWLCEHQTSWVVAAGSADPAEVIAAYRSHLAATECEPDASDFDAVASDWEAYGIPGQLDSGEPYTVDDLRIASARCSNGALVGIRFGSAAGFDSSTLWMSSAENEQIIDRPHDENLIHARGAELIVTLSVSTRYHEVSRGSEPSPASTPEQSRCACYSGSPCECPGG